jgi:SH3-like domain-containing protein
MHPQLMSTPPPRPARRWSAAKPVLAIALGLALHTTGVMAQPAPAFASLVSDHVEVRGAPGSDKTVTLVFKRAGLPVQLLEERSEWAHVRDAEGTSGWIVANLLSRRRTAVVLPAPAGAADATRAMRAAARSTSEVLAYLEPGVIVGVVACDGRSCRITASGVRGFIDQDHLWGVGNGEAIK